MSDLISPELISPTPPSVGPLDLSSLFHPGTFLNALRQHTARQRKVSAAVGRGGGL